MGRGLCCDSGGSRGLCCGSSKVEVSVVVGVWVCVVIGWG